METVIMTYTASITTFQTTEVLSTSVISEWNDDVVEKLESGFFDIFRKRVADNIDLLTRVFISGINRIYPKEVAEKLIRENIFDVSVINQDGRNRIMFAEMFVKNAKEASTDEQAHMVAFHYETCKEVAKRMENEFDILWRHQERNNGKRA